MIKSNIELNIICFWRHRGSIGDRNLAGVARTREGRRSLNLKATGEGEVRCSQYDGMDMGDAQVGELSRAATGWTWVNGEVGQEWSAPPEGHQPEGGGGEAG